VVENQSLEMREVAVEVEGEDLQEEKELEVHVEQRTQRLIVGYRVKGVGVCFFISCAFTQGLYAEAHRWCWVRARRRKV
jgi:hypothetical protein